MIDWTIAVSEEDRERGARLLCEHAEELGLPYTWGTVLNSLLYSLDDNGLLIGRDRDGRVTAALAYTVGTGEDKYADPTRIEVHLLFVEKRSQRGRMPLALMRRLADHLLDLPSPAGVREIVFYAAPTAGNRRLYGKFAALKYTSEQPCGPLDFYSATPESLLEYTGRIQAATRKERSPSW